MKSPLTTTIYTFSKFIFGPCSIAAPGYGTSEKKGRGGGGKGSRREKERSKAFGFLFLKMYMPGGGKEPPEGD